ncbi:hypothetical protein [Streptomyces sp. NPDC060205]|uniref:hypothetical protein n=1 Tax=Streptomyces sp. NPDC060205 TaxID=3347072 RepID=UPI003646BABB
MTRELTTQEQFDAFADEVARELGTHCRTVELIDYDGGLGRLIITGDGRALRLCQPDDRHPDSLKIHAALPDGNKMIAPSIGVTARTARHVAREITRRLYPLHTEAARQAAELAAKQEAEESDRTAFARSSGLLARILDTARPGHRRLVCSVSAAPETLVAVLRADSDPDGASQLDEAEAVEFTTILALGLASGSPGGLVIRTAAPSSPDQVYGWRLRTGDFEPLTAGEIFDAYCTNADSGDLVPPESDVDYCVPPDLGPDATPSTHRR